MADLFNKRLLATAPKADAARRVFADDVAMKANPLLTGIGDEVSIQRAGVAGVVGAGGVASAGLVNLGDLFGGSRLGVDLAGVTIPPTRFTPPVDMPVIDKALINPSLTLQRFEPFSAVFINARHSFNVLRDRATRVEASKRQPLLARIAAFLEEPENAELLTRDLEDLLDDGPPPAAAAEPRDNAAPKPLPPKGLRRAFAGLVPNVNGVITTASGAAGSADARHNEYSALFSLSSLLADDLRQMERLRAAVAGARERRQQDLQVVRGEIEALEDDLQEGRARLEQLDSARLERLDDYSVAQRLLDEHWQAVEQRHRERARILDNHQGLFAVRVRETPVSRSLPDPLALRPEQIGDIVPGCPATPVPVAPALQPLLEAVLDIPVVDWAALEDIVPLLPGREPLALMVALRQQKLAWRLSQPPSATLAAKPTVAALWQANQTATRELLTRPFDAASLLLLQQQSRRILALDDLLASSNPALRQPAQALLARLQAAAGCLLARMRAAPVSLRLDWGNAADADRLPVEQPERWPGLARAEAADFNATRTLLELVAWWFAQLDADASGVARTAMRNFVRGCLVLAASDDPQQMLHGRVRSLPSRFVEGALLRLALNREPLPGSTLQLLDERQRVVGLLRVDDHDEAGTLARVTRVHDASVAINTAMRVIGTLRAV